MGSVAPNMERFRAFLQEDSDGSEPLCMVNLLKFREQASYPEGFDAAPCSGREAYGRYMAEARKCVAAVGGRLVWKAGVLATVIAPDSETWDEVFIVEYPSRSAFARMVSDPGYQAIVPHRTAALADSRLIASIADEELKG